MATAEQTAAVLLANAMMATVEPLSVSLCSGPFRLADTRY